MTTPIRKIVIGENHRSVAVLNRPVEDILSGSGYSSGGEDFAGFSTVAALAAEATARANTDALALAQWGPTKAVGGFTGRNYTYAGGTALVAGVATQIANGSLTLPDNAVSYVERTYAGVVSTNTTGFTTGLVPMAKVTAASGAITALEDWRPMFGPFPYYPPAAGEAGVVDPRYALGHFRRYGAKLDGSTDDFAAVTAALSAAAIAKGSVTSDPGVAAISGMVSIPTGVSVLLPGGALNNVDAAFIFKCTAAGAGVTIATSGGIVQGFTVDGNSIATNCCRWVGGAGRTIINVHSHHAAQDNIIFKVAQNWTVIGCETQLAARDNLVIDDGLGGILFSRFESNQAGRYTLLVDQSVAPTGGYAVPTHITFQHSLFEYLPGGGAADNPTIKGLRGTSIRFQDCVLTGVNAASPTSPVVDFTGGGTWSFRDCDLVPLTNPIGFRVGTSSVLELDGGSGVAAMSSGYVDAVTGSQVRIGRPPGLGAGAPLKTAATPEAVIFHTLVAEQRVSALTSASFVETVSVVGEAGARWRRTASGDYLMGSGTNFSFDAGWQRFGDGTLALLSSNKVSAQAAFTAPVLVPGLVVLTYAASMTPNASLGNQSITPTDGVAFTINAPTVARTGAPLTVRIKNTFGVLGAVTWSSIFKMTAWTQPANGFSRSISFRFDGTNWIEESRTPSDVPN